MAARVMGMDGLPWHRDGSGEGRGTAPGPPGETGGTLESALKDGLERAPTLPFPSRLEGVTAPNRRVPTELSPQLGFVSLLLTLRFREFYVAHC
ncbi:hypothetical protein GCM10017562_08010 [Streptomyces roseofulvus]